MTEPEKTTQQEAAATPAQPASPYAAQQSAADQPAQHQAQPAASSAQPHPPYAAPAQPHPHQAAGQQMPPQQPYYVPASQPQQRPQNMPGMPLLYLTGGMKFGWAVCGFCMGPIAILLAWLTNQSNFPQAKSDAVKFALIGFLVELVVVVLLTLLFGAAACAATTYSHSYYSYY